MTLDRRSIDVVVVGGGPAGATTALLLARAGVSTLVISAAKCEPPPLGETLPPIVNDLLQDLGLLSIFRQQKHLPSNGIVTVWGDAEPGVNDFFRAAHGYGWNLDRTEFDSMLIEESQKAGARVLTGARLVACQRSQGRWKFAFDYNHSMFHVSSLYLVDATGKAGTAAFGSLSKRVVLDRLIGAARFFQCEDSCRYTLVEAVDEGWFYSAGLPDHRLVVVYFTDADIYSHRHKDNPEYWTHQVEKAVRTRRRIEYKWCTHCPVVVSAATSRRVEVAGRDWIAVGDAAHSLDPLSSMGIYKALDSASHACESILKTLEMSRCDSSYRNWSDDVFARYLLQRSDFYLRERRWVHSQFWQRRHIA